MFRDGLLLRGSSGTAGFPLSKEKEGGYYGTCTRTSSRIPLGPTASYFLAISDRPRHIGAWIPVP